MPDTNWVPGLLVLGGGAVAGLVLLLQTRRSPASPAVVDAQGTDLARQRDALYGQIRDLDQSRASMNISDYRAERLRLVVDAAQTLRGLEGAAPVATAASNPRQPTWGDRHPRLVGMLWGGAVVAFGAAVFVGLQQDVKPKEDMAAPTAGAPSRDQVMAMQQGRLEKMVGAAKASYEANPADTKLANAYAHVLLQAGEVMPAFEVSKKVTDTKPEDPEARTHQAIVLMEIGDMAMATALLEKVLEHDPNFAEALGYRGAIAYNAGDFAMAADRWTQAKAADPSMAPMLEPLISNARAGGMSATSPSAGAGPGVSGAPPAAAPSAAAPSAADVSGTVVLGAGVNPPGRGIMFVSARPTGVEAGPPAAAKRLPVAAFPMEFRIGPGDSPMGGPFPVEMTLTASVDHDGNPTTKEPEDLVGRAEHVKPGQTEIAITLMPRGP